MSPHHHIQSHLLTLRRPFFFFFNFISKSKTLSMPKLNSIKTRSGEWRDTPDISWTITYRSMKVIWKLLFCQWKIKTNCNTCSFEICLQINFIVFIFLLLHDIHFLWLAHANWFHFHCVQTLNTFHITREKRKEYFIRKICANLSSYHFDEKKNCQMVSDWIFIRHHDLLKLSFIFNNFLLFFFFVSFAK